MKAELARLQTAVDHAHRDIAEIKTDLRGLRGEARADFRLTWGALIVGFLGIAGLMARGFGWL